MPNTDSPSHALRLHYLLFLCLLLLSACGGDPRLSKLDPGEVVLAFGDSLTWGKGAGRSDSYPAVLAGLTGWQIINGGISGEISADGLRRLPGLLSEHRPRLVIITHGGNDLLRRMNLNSTSDNLREMIRLSREAGAEVVMLGVPRPGLILRTAEFYESIAMELNVPIEPDAISDVLQYPANKSDAVHPNAKGYHEMAKRIYDLLDSEGAIQGSSD